MRLAVVLALSLFFANCGSAMAAGTPAASDQKSAKDYISKTRIGGYIGNDALLVLPDRTAGAAPIGGFFGAMKLVEIGNTSYTLEYGGTQGKITLDPSWQIAPHPDLTNWLIAFMKAAGLKIDAQHPDVTQQGVIHIAKNGAVSSNFMKVQQANPFESLPDYLDSIDLKVSINPHDPTKVQFVSMTVTPQTYERLLKPLYTVPASKAAQ